MSNLTSRRGASSLWAALAAAVLAGATPTASAQPAATDSYLRAGFLLDQPDRTRFTDRDCASTSPAALYGCGTGIDGMPLGTWGEFGAAAGYELGFGYAVGTALRLEAVVMHRPRTLFEGQANFLQTRGMQEVSADVSALTAMLAAYVDLPALGLPPLGPFAPFVGGGVGLSRLAIGETRMAFARTTTLVPGGHRLSPAWMPTAGVAMTLGPRVTLDVAWRHTHLGAVDSGRGTGRIVWRDGSRDPLELALAETTATLASHGFSVALRYAF